MRVIAFFFFLLFSLLNVVVLTSHLWQEVEPASVIPLEEENYDENESVKEIFFITQSKLEMEDKRLDSEKHIHNYLREKFYENIPLNIPYPPPDSKTLC